MSLTSSIGTVILTQSSALHYFFYAAFGCCFPPTVTATGFLTLIKDMKSINIFQLIKKNSAINITEQSTLFRQRQIKQNFQSFDPIFLNFKNLKILFSFQLLKYHINCNYKPQKQSNDSTIKKNIYKFIRVKICIKQFIIIQILNLLLKKNMFQETFDQQENRTKQIAPNNTIYISNLNQKVPIDELKDTLYNTYQQYGQIIDIIAKKNIRMRGQAFVIYRDINSAMQAKRKLNGKQLYGKTMRIQFAKQKSDVISKIDGTFQIRQKPENYFQVKFQQKFIKRPQQQLKAKVQRQKNVLKKTDNSANPPNHILFCQGLNPSITSQMLTVVFIRYPGLVDVRLAPKNFAFIEYQDQFKAGTALAALNQTALGDATLKLSYAKK